MCSLRDTTNRVNVIFGYTVVFFVRCVLFGKRLLRKKYMHSFPLCTFRESVSLSRENRRSTCDVSNVSFKIVDFRCFLFRDAAQSRAKSFSSNGLFRNPETGQVPPSFDAIPLIPHFAGRNYSCNSSSSSRFNAHVCAHFTFFFFFIYLFNQTSRH